MGTLTGKQSTMTLLTMSALWRKDTAGILAQLKQSIHLRRHRSGSFPRVTRVRIRIYTDDEEVNSEASWMGACIQQASEKELFAPASLLPVDLELPLFGRVRRRYRRRAFRNFSTCEEQKWQPFPEA